MPNKIKKNQVETPYVSQGRDAFKTPNYAIELLVPFIPSYIVTVWEPACGGFKISDNLSLHGYKVICSDITAVSMCHNFLKDEEIKEIRDYKTCIITNPPFSAKKSFYEKCREYDLPFALLVRIDYITPSGLSGKTGNTSSFHSCWITWKFNLGKSELFVPLTNEMKKNI